MMPLKHIIFIARDNGWIRLSRRKVISLFEICLFFTHSVAWRTWICIIWPKRICKLRLRDICGFSKRGRKRVLSPVYVCWIFQDASLKNMQVKFAIPNHIRLYVYLGIFSSVRIIRNRTEIVTIYSLLFCYLEISAIFHIFEYETLQIFL